MKKTQVLYTAAALGLLSFALVFVVRWLTARLTGQPFTMPNGFEEWSEVIGFVTGVVAVYLVVKEHILNWPVGIINVVIYAIFFYFFAKHYANAGLQIVFLAYSIDGWWRWKFGGAQRTELKISRIKSYEVWIAASITVLGTAVLVPILKLYGGNFVFLDALTTSISLAAQFLVNRKVLQNWWFWIVADAIYVPLYLYRTYYLTAVLYFVFLVLAILGLREWKRTLEKISA
jgi:nicotinamide mononucleotide transporter